MRNDSFERTGGMADFTRYSPGVLESGGHCQWDLDFLTLPRTEAKYYCHLTKYASVPYQAAH